MSARQKTKNCQIIQNLKNMDYLISYLENCINDDELSSQVIFRAIYKILEIDQKAALNLITKYKCNIDNKSYLALLIKIYAENELFNSALSIYESIPDDHKKKRFIIVIYNKLAELDKDRAFELLNLRIYRKFKLTEDDISKIYDVKYINEICQMLSDNEIKIENTNFFTQFDHCISHVNDCKCSNCFSKINKFNLDDNDITNLKTNILEKYTNSISKNELNKLDIFLENNEFNMFLDGNNILFFKDRKININSFRRLMHIYNKVKSVKNPLIFIHIRHKNFIRKLGGNSNEARRIFNSLPIYYTPYKMNDDWFFIWAGLSIKNSIVLTNDMLRDHIYSISEESLISNTLSVWINNNIARYEFYHGNYQIQYPLEYSVKIQKLRDIWHIPVNDGSWLCMIKN